ncbi:hypothetical protein BKA67DRAFT_379895 [Truncatella angustata]|uniref:Chromo domain-containing protein n=1 Tax=Truncatella angustata TaxID=152316 RepID=A0A9P8UFJ6_9PEZI|nr:uncharacterized protein BKA67DRAFT_379895 [Truncatella angustata]KAH6649051.1 hypothetical protein BKA67DRAFT_379895 [Truncatella angustata]
MPGCDLGRGGDSGRRNSPQHKRKSRPRVAARYKSPHVFYSSSSGSDDEGVVDDWRQDDEDFQPPQRKRHRQYPVPRVSTRRRDCLDGTESRVDLLYIPSPPSSENNAKRESTGGTPTAVFEEWPLVDAVLKRITEDGRTIFQLQFTEATCATHGRQYHAIGSPEPRSSIAAAPLAKRGTRRRAQRETGHATQDDQEECHIEAIRHHRFTEPNNGVLQLHVEWKNSQKKTWEPVEEFEETIAHDIYLAHNDISKPSSRPKRGRPRKALASGAAAMRNV